MHCSHPSAWLAAACLALTACSTQHEFRVAAVGDASGSATSETTSTIPSAPLVVAAGNVLLGESASLASITPGAQTSGVVDGTVSAVLLTSGQSLIELSDGSSLLINSVGGALGDAVSIDVGKGQVIGGPNSLVGVSVLPSGGTGGQLASATVGGTSIGVGTGLVGKSTSAAGGLVSGTAGQTLGAVSATTTLTQPVTTTLPPVSGTVGHICC
ncbi:MAG TPA: hypothetical protein VF067_00260 [Sphingomicrobium sp.]